MQLKKDQVQNRNDDERSADLSLLSFACVREKSWRVLIFAVAVPFLEALLKK
jgi:hypothetical protein